MENVKTNTLYELDETVKISLNELKKEVIIKAGSNPVLSSGEKRSVVESNLTIKLDEVDAIKFDKNFEYTRFNIGYMVGGYLLFAIISIFIFLTREFSLENILLMNGIPMIGFFLFGGFAKFRINSRIFFFNKNGDSVIIPIKHKMGMIEGQIRDIERFEYYINKLKKAI